MRRARCDGSHAIVVGASVAESTKDVTQFQVTMFLRRSILFYIFDISVLTDSEIPTPTTCRL